MNGVTVTPEQIQTLVAVVSAMLVMNAGSLVGGAFRAYFVWRKMQQDIRAAHDKIRKHDVRITDLEGQNEE